MVFTDAEKVLIRKYCGYPFLGNVNTSAFGVRFTTWYGSLEYRMNSLSDNETSLVRTTFLANLTAIEADMYGSYIDLDTNKAAVWERNPKEIRDKWNLFVLCRKQLCEFMGVPYCGPYAFMDQHQAYFPHAGGGVDVLL
jgi:hypothetical protein